MMLLSLSSNNSLSLSFDLSLSLTFLQEFLLCTLFLHRDSHPSFSKGPSPAKKRGSPCRYITFSCVCVCVVIILLDSVCCSISNCKVQLLMMMSLCTLEDSKKFFIFFFRGSFEKWGRFFLDLWGRHIRKSFLTQFQLSISHYTYSALSLYICCCISASIIANRSLAESPNISLSHK